MKEILFASTNISKIEQFQFVADTLECNVKITSVYKRYPQLQTYSEEYNSCREIVEQGSLEIWNQIHLPVIVEDSIFEVEALGNRPGLTASEYLKEYGRQGIIKELNNNSNRRARMTSCIGYRINQTGYTLYENIINGNIALEERYKIGEPHWIGPTHHPLGGGFSAIFIPDNAGGKTISELTALENITYGYREPNFRRVLEKIIGDEHDN